jgi:osmotically-inducible protein OsmY
MRRSLAVLMMLGATFSAIPGAGCAHAAFADDQKASSPDDRISDQVRMRLATDADVKGGALDVIVKDGVVTIKGRVDSDKGKQKATRLAKKVKGVKEVDNELAVGPPTQ